MPRIRDIKPEFFMDEELAQVSLAARLCFVGLWTLADREGRMEDRPARIRAHLFPYDAVSVEPLLAELARGKFIVRYVVGEGNNRRAFLEIRSFCKHQRPHPKEQPSAIPAPEHGRDVDCPGIDDHDEPFLEAASREQEREAAEGFLTAATLGDPAGTRPSGSSGSSAPSGPSEIGSGALAARAPDPMPLARKPEWRSGNAWRQAFGVAWGGKYDRFYGNTSDGKAIRDLEDFVLADMPEDELVRLWEIRVSFFLRFLASTDPRIESGKHAFALFVARFSDFRPDLRVTPVGLDGKPAPLDCAFHARGQNQGKRAAKHVWRRDCPECKHLDARAGPRPASGPTGIGELLDGRQGR